MGSILERGSL